MRFPCRGGARRTALYSVRQVGGKFVATESAGCSALGLRTAGDQVVAILGRSRGREGFRRAADRGGADGERTPPRGEPEGSLAGGTGTGES
jgi:hypothetical protein